VQIQGGGHAERGTGGLHQANRNGQDHIEHDVLGNRDRQHDAGEPGGQQIEVMHDPGDHRDAGHRYRQAEHQDKCGVIAGRADELPSAQGCDQAQPRRERQDHAEPGDQPHRAHRVALQEPAHLRTGREHQQQQAELINRTQRGGRHPGGWEDPLLDPGCDRGQDRGAEQDAPDDLPDRGRLPEPGEQAAHAVGGNQQNRQRDQQPGQVNVGETQSSPRIQPAGSVRYISSHEPGTEHPHRA
jgi:hypothetical protein